MFERRFLLSRTAFAAAMLLLVSAGSGCLFRSRPVQVRLSKAPLKSATAAELIANFNAMATSIQTLNATVDIDPTLGGVKKGSYTDFSEIRGYILAQKPSSLRMIGLMPVVRTRAFDMVSDADGFRLWIPPTNQFILGPSEVTSLSDKPLENLRPSVIYQAILPAPIDPVNEIAVLESGTQRLPDAKGRHTLQQADYRLNILARDAQGHWQMERRIYYSRETLTPYRLVIFNAVGEVATEASFADYKLYNGQSYPSFLTIERPQEEYSITLHIIALKINEPLTADQFTLEQPVDVKVKRLGEKPAEKK